ncbi:MAG: hypothetical protein JXI33_04090 [Candidatus Aminicenantes bacterium]|nr:hypothetical protein [Candidatus Aminicenantes bacterium]
MIAENDHDYIIRIIQFLDRQFAIRFFISSRDFDILYRWWEKRIPTRVINGALGRVVERRLAQGKPIVSFSVFSREVRLAYQSFLNLNVGHERNELRDEHGEIKAFLKQFPQALEFLKADFTHLAAEYIRTGAVDSGPLYEKLLDRFQDDDELNAKCAWFLNHLAPDLRRPEIEKKYRLNYLLHKFAVPSFG